MEPAIQLAEMTVESDETVPLPISRRIALDGGDVTLKFAAVETVVTTATMTVGFPSRFPAAGRGLPFQVLLGERPDTLLRSNLPATIRQSKRQGI